MEKKVASKFNVIEDLVSSGEWDHVRYLIKEELSFLNKTNIDTLKENQKEFLLPWNTLYLFEREIKNKLIAEGFKKEIIEDSQELFEIVYSLDHRVCPSECPESVRILSSDKKTFDP